MLHAQEAWAPLYTDAAAGARLEWRVRPSETGVMVQIRNMGTTRAHFDLRMGAESVEQAKARGRAHLDAGAKMALILPAAPPEISVYEVRNGEGDVLPSLGN